MSLEGMVDSISCRMFYQPHRQDLKGDTASYMGNLFRVLDKTDQPVNCAFPSTGWLLCWRRSHFNLEQDDLSTRFLES